MRYGKLLLGSFVVLVSVWVIVAEQVSGVSSDAVVNARLATVRAPVAGRLDMPLRAFGEEFMKGDVIAELTNIHAGDGRLDDLRQEEALAAAELAYQVTLRNGSRSTLREQISGIRLASNEAAAALADDESTGVGIDGAEMRRAAERLAAIQTRIARQQAREAENALVRLEVPVDGVLWEVLAGDGEYVERGQEIGKLMACGSALVTLSVPSHVYSRLRVGHEAAFRLDGASRVYTGTITRMAGAGAETIYRNLAVAPSLKHLERFDIALLVPELRTDPELRCRVGQSGRVFFDSRPLDWLRTALR
jgi:multidrug efflux pump subunit AcrA (membrane-fusion protein)